MSALSVSSTSSAVPNTTQELVEILLQNRSIDTPEKRERFFHPISPLEISLTDVEIDEQHMIRAIEIIKNAIDEKKKIVIFGDYDADGVSATSIVWIVLHSLGADVVPFVPSREKHGYGLSDAALDDVFAQVEPSVLITVDNGIVAFQPFERLKKQGVQTILTDHHQLDHGQVPVADCVIHSTKLCGATVGWMLARSVELALTGKTTVSESTLDLCGVATIADQVPLLDANRSFAFYGLRAMQKTERIGLRLLMEAAHIDQSSISTYGVNFGVVPRLNAMGRLSDALDAVRVLCAGKELTARPLVLKLHDTNTERQSMVYSSIDLAFSMKQDWTNESIVVIAHETFHEGVIGLVAGRIVEEVYKPAIVMSLGKDVIKGSARSVPGVNITDLLRELKSELIDVGGHPMAAGFSVAASNRDSFMKKIRALAKKIINPSLLKKQVHVECTLPWKLVTKETATAIESFEPFGQGNSVPTFLIQDIELLGVQPVGREANHMKLRLLGEGNLVGEAMWFGVKEKEQLLLSSLIEKKVDIVCSLQKRSWNGKTTVQVVVKEMEESQK